MSQLPDDCVRDVCRLSAGAECCRYLAGSPAGWLCAKLTNLREQLDRRVAEGKMVARGDNCEGWASRNGVRPLAS